MLDESQVGRIERAIVDELRRQRERHGVSVDDNGQWVQVNGSLKLRPLALAVMRAMRAGGGEI